MHHGYMYAIERAWPGAMPIRWAVRRAAHAGTIAGPMASAGDYIINRQNGPVLVAKALWGLSRASADTPTSHSPKAQCAWTFVGCVKGSA